MKRKIFSLTLVIAIICTMTICFTGCTDIDDPIVTRNDIEVSELVNAKLSLSNLTTSKSNVISILDEMITNENFTEVMFYNGSIISEIRLVQNAIGVDQKLYGGQKAVFEKEGLNVYLYEYNESTREYEKSSFGLSDYESLRNQCTLTLESMKTIVKNDFEYSYSTDKLEYNGTESEMQGSSVQIQNGNELVISAPDMKTTYKNIGNTVVDIPDIQAESDGFTLEDIENVVNNIAMYDNYICEEEYSGFKVRYKVAQNGMVLSDEESQYFIIKENDEYYNYYYDMINEEMVRELASTELVTIYQDQLSEFENAINNIKTAIRNNEYEYDETKKAYKYTGLNIDLQNLLLKLEDGNLVIEDIAGSVKTTYSKVNEITLTAPSVNGNNSNNGNNTDNSNNNDLSLPLTIVIVIMLVFLVVAIVLGILLSQYKNVIIYLYNILDDGTKQMIGEIGQEADARLKDLENNEIKEYNRQRNEITKAANDAKHSNNVDAQSQQSQATTYYNNRNMELFNAKDNMGMANNSRERSATSNAIRQEQMNANRQIDEQSKRALADLKAQYKDVLDEYERLKFMCKNSKKIGHIFKKLDKKENA